MAAILDIKSPSDTLICLFPSYTFLPRTYYFLHISQPAEICRTDRLDAPGESCHVTYFGLLCYRNSSCQKYYYNVYEFLEN